MNKCGEDSIGVLCCDCYELGLTMIVIKRRLINDKRELKASVLNHTPNTAIKHLIRDIDDTSDGQIESKHS